jgi:hypothetical protein
MVVRTRGARLGAVVTDSLAIEIGQGLHREVPRGRGAHAWQGSPSCDAQEWSSDGEAEAQWRTEAFRQRAAVWRLKMGLAHFLHNCGEVKVMPHQSKELERVPVA